MFINAVGKACPIPVVMAKKELDGGCTDLVVAVDNAIAVQNLTRLASGRGLNVSSEEQDVGFHVHISGTGAPAAEGTAPPLAACGPQGCGYTVFIGKDHLGEGDQELGYNLLRMALFTLSQGDTLPASVLFMNGGVRLPAGEDAQARCDQVAQEIGDRLGALLTSSQGEPLSQQVGRLLLKHGLTVATAESGTAGQLASLIKGGSDKVLLGGMTVPTDSQKVERLGVPEKIAVEDACKIEHVISKESFQAIKNHAGTQ